jgi:hypothetical protein
MMIVTMMELTRRAVKIRREPERKNAKSEVRIARPAAAMPMQ